MLFAERVAALTRRLEELSSLLVAVSGGVDSAALLGVAARSVRGPVLAATTKSPAVPDEEIAAAADVAARFGVAHRVVETRELEAEGYRRNDGDRCYFCRHEMYGRLRHLAAAEGIAFLADGLQADDRADDRPGMLAAAEHGVLHPLRDLLFGKAQIRRLAWGLGLALHGKPAQPCLASRLPVGIAVTPERLALVNRAESALRRLGFAEVRVRCERSHGRIEVGPPELDRARALAGQLEAAVKAAGFESAAVDPRGYRG